VPTVREGTQFKRGTDKSLTPKQIRARARRRAKRGKKPNDDELEILYGRPLEEWDDEELAHGRPRDRNGQFRGPKPKWISREMHELSLERFRDRVKEQGRVLTLPALKTFENLLTNDEVDDKGRPLVPFSVKADIAKFLFEHIVGKPTQPIKADVNVKLQGILANVMVNASGELAASHRQIEDILDAEFEEEESS
jgi:hypothetical protein